MLMVYMASVSSTIRSAKPPTSRCARLLRPAPSPSSTAAIRERSFSPAYSASASTVLSPMPRLGSLMMRRTDTSSSGFTSARM